MQAIVTGVPGYDRFLYELTVARILRSDVRWGFTHEAIIGRNGHLPHCPGSIVEATLGAQVGANRGNLTDWSGRSRIPALNEVISASDYRSDGRGGDQHRAVLRQGILQALNTTPLLTAGVSRESKQG